MFCVWYPFKILLKSLDSNILRLVVPYKTFRLAWKSCLEVPLGQIFHQNCKTHGLGPNDLRYNYDIKWMLCVWHPLEILHKSPRGQHFPSKRRNSNESVHHFHVKSKNWRIGLDDVDSKRVGQGYHINKAEEFLS